MCDRHGWPGVGLLRSGPPADVGFLTGAADVDGWEAPAPLSMARLATRPRRCCSGVTSPHGHVISRATRRPFPGQGAPRPVVGLRPSRSERLHGVAGGPGSWRAVPKFLPILDKLYLP